jgi:hypothetical protein
MKYDVFISYRRDGGEYTAKIIHDKLTELGYRVFFDVESLRSGQFNTKLFSVIDECTDFISVLSPNCLERCTNENDWVRLEISYALQKGKNVVPVLLRNFQFPEELPADIDAIRYRSGIEASTEFFDAFARRLAEFLKTKPKIVHRISQNSLVRKVIPLVIALFLVFGITMTGYQIYQRTHASFPYTKADKNMVKELIYYVSTNFSEANIVLFQYEKALKSYQDFLDNPTDSNYLVVTSDLKNSKEMILAAKEKFIGLDESLSHKLDDTIFEKDDIIALKDYLMTCTDEIVGNLDFMSFMLSDQCYLTTTSVGQVIDDYQKILEIDRDTIFYGVNDIFVQVDEDALKEFRSEFLVTVPSIYNGQEWRKEKEEIQMVVDATFARYGEILNNISSIVGNLNVEANQYEVGMDELNDMIAEEDALKEEAREKFKPLDTDTIDILWGKMLRFNTLKMYDMCIECLDLYSVKDTTAETKIYVPIAQEYFRQINKTGIDYGCLVCQYEPEKPHNSFYLIGDILIELNG